MVEIDYRQLSCRALDNLLIEIVLREGTDYGLHERSFDSKKQQLKSRLEAGNAVIVYLPGDDYCDVIDKN
ncbi:MAG: YheU family protein [Coxiellaceae bacterium]|nr:YheU family protein [Coxiellaceae bacterium]